MTPDKDKPTPQVKDYSAVSVSPPLAFQRPGTLTIFTERRQQ
jgi:hypothetical protein